MLDAKIRPLPEMGNLDCHIRWVVVSQSLLVLIGHPSVSHWAAVSTNVASAACVNDRYVLCTLL